MRELRQLPNGYLIFSLRFQHLSLYTSPAPAAPVFRAFPHSKPPPKVRRLCSNTFLSQSRVWCQETLSPVLAYNRRNLSFSVKETFSQSSSLSLFRICVFSSHLCSTANLTMVLVDPVVAGRKTSNFFLVGPETSINSIPSPFSYLTNFNHNGGILGFIMQCFLCRFTRRIVLRRNPSRASWRTSLSSFPTPSCRRFFSFCQLLQLPGFIGSLQRLSFSFFFPALYRSCYRSSSSLTEHPLSPLSPHLVFSVPPFPNKRFPSVQYPHLLP